MHRRSSSLAAAALCVATSALPGSAWADAGREGKLLLTGGVSSIDGAAGGGLTPWAVTGSYATDRAVGATAFATRVVTQDHRLTVAGAAVAWGDRAELSLARQGFDTGPVGRALGLAGLKLKQDILGLKVRIAGDAVLDSDLPMPQIALGLEHKRADAGALGPALAAFGARDHGTDLYASATKLFLAQGVLVNATLRATNANQNGLLGFGATGHKGLSLQPEVSLAWLLRHTLAVGAEYRAKPDNLRDNAALGAGTLREDDWADVFIAWAPCKNFSLTAAWVDLGRIVPGVTPRRQTGAYLSAQAAF